MTPVRKHVICNMFPVIEYILKQRSVDRIPLMIYVRSSLCLWPQPIIPQYCPRFVQPVMPLSVRSGPHPASQWPSGVATFMCSSWTVVLFVSLKWSIRKHRELVRLWHRFVLLSLASGVFGSNLFAGSFWLRLVPALFNYFSFHVPFERQIRTFYDGYRISTQFRGT